MSKTIQSITNPKLRLEILTPQEVKKIHDATLWIIEKVGVRFPSKRALEIWAANGAEVDHEKMVVRAKGELIEKALEDLSAGLFPGGARPATGSAAGWQPRLCWHGRLRRGSDRYQDRRAPDLPPAGCARYCPHRGCDRASGFPLGAGLGAGYAPRDTRPARDQGHLGKFHQARSDRIGLQRKRSTRRD